MQRISYLTVVCMLCIAFIMSAEGSLYGLIPPERYLIGNFDISEDPSLFVAIDGLPVGYPMSARHEAVSQLYAMVYQFQNLYPNITIPVVSSLRNYTSQSKIWNNKWTGSYANISNPTLRALGILEWSSMPGTSRHHWGTDFDLYSLDNDDFGTGDGLLFYNWMVANAKKYGFCQPYTAGRCAGYNEEKWHWSYTPLSAPFYHDWVQRYASGPICNWSSQCVPPFLGLPSALSMAPTYVTTVSPLCLAPLP